jgi:hypothetical protein
MLFESNPTSELPYFIRIYTSPKYIGECWSKLESCPDTRLFITVSVGDLYEVPQLYELPAAKGWKFISHSTLDKGRVELVLVTTLPEANLDPEVREAWVAQEYRVSVGHQASYEVSSMRNKSSKADAVTGAAS